MQFDAYLFNPSNLNRTLFVDDFVSASGLFTDDVWLTGLWPTTFGGSFTESSGRIAPTDMSSATDAPKSYTGYSVSHGEWVHKETDSSFICETDPGKYFSVPVHSKAICFLNMNTSFKMLTQKPLREKYSTCLLLALKYNTYAMGFNETCLIVFRAFLFSQSSREIMK